MPRFIFTMEIQPTLNNFAPNSIDWHKYNLAKTQEKRLFYELLKELCDIIPLTHQQTGRPRVQVRDLIFCACLKLYSNYSGRKISSDLVHARQAKFIQHAPHYNTLSEFLNCEEVYDILQKLLTVSALPLKNLEDHFSLDSSGFGARQYERWITVRHEGKRQHWKNFLKGHILIGTRTNIICACEITPGTWADINQAPKLIEHTANNFNMKEFSADKAYSSKKVHQIVEALGAIPYIPFKHNANPNRREGPAIWVKMYRHFKINRESFLRHYHKRSNVETTFMMIKQRLGEYLKSKTFASQRNELMIKFICHNICCLIAEIFENDIHVNFKQTIEKYVDRKIEPVEEKPKPSHPPKWTY